MSYANGKIPTSALATISPGNQLLKSTANAYKGLVLLGHVVGIHIAPAGGLGSAYRSLATQAIFYRASMGSVKDEQLADLNPNSNIRVAAPGYSPHGLGTCIDLLFNGSASPSETGIALANRFGFTRPFGKDDANHFQHNGRTAIGGPSAADRVRILAHYYNGRHLGKATTSDKDGVVDKSGHVEQIYTWLVQTAGHKDGLYRVPPYVIDGKWGPHTEGVDSHYWNVLWASA